MLASQSWLRACAGAAHTLVGATATTTSIAAAAAAAALSAPVDVGAVTRRHMASAVPNTPLVLVDHDSSTRVTTVTLNSPDRMNAMTADMGNQFREVVTHLSDNCDDVGAVVLTGAGRAFSAGGDLRFLKQRHEDTPSRNAAVMRKFYSRFLCVRDLPMPVVAAINGPAIGAGLCVALACDIRVASVSAKLGITFVGLGLHPGMGATHFLPSIVGPQIASRMMLTGEVISGEEAAELGLVAQATPADETLDTALALAGKIASQSPIAVRATVRSLRLKQDEGLDKALWREADAQSYCYASKDLGEGVDAVAGKRPPSFSQYEHYHESP